MFVNLFLISLLYITSTIGENLARNNQTILMEMITKELTQIIDQQEIDYTVTLEPSNSYAKQELTHYLVNAGFRISSIPNEHTFQLVIQGSGTNILTRTGHNRYQRALHVEVYANVIDQTGSVISSHRFLIEKTDQLKHTSPELLEGSWQASKFSVNKHTGFSGFIRKIGQPLLIATAVGTTIYLLYNVRSQ
jgi:hypothetical protein